MPHAAVVGAGEANHREQLRVMARAGSSRLVVVVAPLARREKGPVLMHREAVPHLSVQMAPSDPRARGAGAGDAVAGGGAGVRAPEAPRAEPAAGPGGRGRLAILGLPRCGKWA